MSVGGTLGMNGRVIHAGGMRGDPFERMYSAVRELLWRQRQIQPFPCDKDEVLVSLLPPEMQDWVLLPQAPKSMTIEWSNLTQCVSCDTSVIVELEGETGKAFWMRFDKRVPVPSQVAAFNLPSTNLHYDKLCRWWERANVIHEELKLYQTGLWDFLQRANHPKLVEKYWTELHPFVDFQLHAGALAPDLDKRRLMPLPSQEDREKIVEVLAASTLLPKLPCSAWVDYEVEE